MNEPNNPDPTNPDPTNPDPTNPDPTNPEAVESPMPQVEQSEEAIRVSTQEPTMAYAAATPPPQKTGWRSRLGLGAAALGLLAVGAVGGFALTHAVGDGEGPGHDPFGERHRGDFHQGGEHGPGHLPPAQDDVR